MTRSRHVDAWESPFYGATANACHIVETDADALGTWRSKKLWGDILGDPSIGTPLEL
jgi:hypothetical protein